MDNNLLRKTFRLWIPFAVAIILISGMIYMGIQQNYRQSANDPQIQIAEDISTALLSGVPPQAIANPGATDIGKSIGTFIIIYNSSKSAVLSSATLDGKTPQVPNGIFDKLGFHSGVKDQSRFTWEPKDGIRIAAVIQKYGDKQSTGYVLVGRSLREAERRILQFQKDLLIGVVATLAVTFLAIYFTNRISVKANPRRKSK